MLLSFVVVLIFLPEFWSQSDSLYKVWSICKSCSSIHLVLSNVCVTVHINHGMLTQDI